jgi:phosphodiesterase/alkaline phosphatase D-like protein
VRAIILRACILVAPATLAIACGDPVENDRTEAVTERAAPDAGALDYGPILRAVDTQSARFLFRAAPPDGEEVPWTAGIEIGPSLDLDPDTLIPVPEVQVAQATDFVAHVTVEGLRPQTRYTYVPLVNGRRALANGPGGLPSFVTPPDLGDRNADFTAVFLADQHVANVRETVPLPAYDVAARQQPLFWAQLGDVAAGSLVPQREEDRSRADIRRIWSRNFGDPTSPQVRFARAHSLTLATFNDHEVMNNYSMNWHQLHSGGENATLHDRVARYDRSIGPWWDYFGWGVPLTDRLGQVALEDHGGSVMAEPSARVVADVSERTVCVVSSDGARFSAGSFVYLADNAGDPFHTRVASVGSPGDCGEGEGTTVTLEERPSRSFRRDRDARIAVGARYTQHGHYHSYSPFPFVEFFLLDTTSYRGDDYQERRLDREANRDTDHSRYSWDSGGGYKFIYGDREHGANRTTDNVRSWLGPQQKRAFLQAIAGSRADVLVVAAGYPLYSSKFEHSKKNWEGRESGLDFATELEEIVSALEQLEKLVLWVHGDGHTPLLVRLRENLYQLQIGATLVGHTESPGHRPRTLASGDRAEGDFLGGGTLIASHQPSLKTDGTGGPFREHLDQFEGCLRLYFHPGRDVLRNAERDGLRRGENDHVVEIPAEEDPAGKGARRHIGGKVVRLHFGEDRRHSAVRSYRFEDGRARFELEDPIVTRDPDVLRVIIDGNPWVEAKWFDSRGREWRDFSTVMRKTAAR